MRQRNSPFTYDSHGQCKGMRQRNSPFTYDSHGQCKGMRQRNSPFTYDSHGQSKGMRQRNSPFTYDNANDILECAYNLNGFRTKTKLKNTVLCLIELLIVEAVLK